MPVEQSVLSGINYRSIMRTHNEVLICFFSGTRRQPASVFVSNADGRFSSRIVRKDAGQEARMALPEHACPSAGAPLRSTRTLPTISSCSNSQGRETFGPRLLSGPASARRERHRRNASTASCAQRGPASPGQLTRERLSKDTVVSRTTAPRLNCMRDPCGEEFRYLAEAHAFPSPEPPGLRDRSIIDKKTRGAVVDHGGNVSFRHRAL